MVNMILINMMMAIINLAFEDIKSNEESYQNRFEIVEYIRRFVRETVGISVAKPIVPVYIDEDSEAEEGEGHDPTEKVSIQSYYLKF